MRVSAIIAVGVVVLMACDQDPAADSTGWPRHEALGISFAVPPDYDLTVGDDEIHMIAMPNRRISRTIELYLTGVPRDIAGAIASDGTVPATFAVYERQGGSGGQDYALSIVKTFADRPIHLIARTQSDGIPPFPEAWAVWESLSPAD